MAVTPIDRDSETEDPRLTALYREAAREDSPPQLDLTVMAAAREGLATRRGLKRSWWISWQVPFAIAALGLISVSLVSLMMDEGADRLGRLESQSDGAKSSLPREDARVQAPSVASQPGSATSSRAPLERAIKRADVQKPSEARIELPARPLPPELPGDRVSRELAAARDTTAPAAPAAAGSDTAQYSSAPAAAPPVASNVPARRETDARAAEERAASPAAAARSALLSRAEPQLRRQETGAGASSEIDVHELERHMRELASENARVWLERIQRLRREGRGAEAKALLDEFRRRFPEEAVPPELR